MFIKLNEFRGICQVLFFLTKIRKDSIQLHKVRYYADGIKNILNSQDNQEYKTTNLLGLFKNFV